MHKPHPLGPGGLWLNGPVEATPDGSLRRATNLHPIPEAGLRSRFGATLAYALAGAHSFVRWSGARYQGAGTAFYKNGVSIKTGLDGKRLCFASMPTTVETDTTQLFVHDGSINAGFKVASGGLVSQWGIEPPVNSMVPVVITQQSKVIEAFDNQSANYTVTSDSDGGALLPGDDATMKVSGASSLVCAVPADRSVAVKRTFASKNLNQTDTPSTFTSTDEDYIQLWVHLTRPLHLESFTLGFCIGTPPGGTTPFISAYTKEVLVEDHVGKKAVNVARGLGDLIPIKGQDLEFLAATRTKPEDLKIQELLGTTKLIAERSSWTRLRIPKSTFNKSGPATAGWEDIQGISLSLRTNALGGCVVYFDAMSLVGSVGMQGDYDYYATFKSSTTGSRSNPTAVASITAVDRQGVTLGSLPISSATRSNAELVADGIDKLELWRTLGNGGVPFFLVELPIGTTTYDDRIADYYGLRGATTTLGDLQLPTDNALPPIATRFAGPHYGRLWWAGPRGFVSYSPAGRPESLGGDVEVSSAADPVLDVVIWGDTLFAFTPEKVYEIVGTTEPFTAREIEGVPGKRATGATAVAPQGVFYWAADGLRRLSGASSELVGAAALAPFWRGETREGLQWNPVGDFQLDYGAEELWITDNNLLLAYYIAADRWRVVACADTAIHAVDFEVDTSLWCVALDSKVVLFSNAETQLQDNLIPIPFAVQTGALTLAAGERGLAQRLFIEANTRGQWLVPTAILDGVEITLPQFMTTSQQVVEFAVGRLGRVASVRLTGALSAQVEIVGIAWDVYSASENDQ